MACIRTSVVAFAVLLVASVSVVNAQEYDDVFGDNVDFINIEETTGGGLFGQPMALGDDLNFPVPGFTAEGIDGAIDFVNGMIRLDLSSNSGQAFNSVTLDEFGVYFNTGNSVSSVDAFITVVTNDGMFNGEFGMDFGTGSGIWEGSATVTFPETLQAKVFIHNILLADSEVDEVASINKRKATIRVGVIPEPTSAGLLMAGLVGFALRRKRK